MPIAYGVLNAKSPEYLGDVWSELSDLYAGGYQLQKNAKRYLPQYSYEHHSAYKDRIQCAGYFSYLGQIIDYFASALFAEDLAVTDAPDADDPTTVGAVADDEVYGAFAKDADRKGTPFSRVIRQAFINALLKKRSIVAVDFPVASFAPTNRAEEDAAGVARPYAFEVPVEQLLDWSDDEPDAVKEFGLTWAILKRTTQVRLGPEQPRGKFVDEFKVWRRDQVSGVVTWELYRTKPYDEQQPPKDDDYVDLVAGPTATSFNRIPLVELAIPDGLWVGNKIGTNALEHFQRRTMLVSAENKSLVAIPYVALSEQAPGPGEGIPNDIAFDNSRGVDPVGRFHQMGFNVLAKGDVMAFAEPVGAAYALVDSQLSGLKDEMFRVVHQMAASVDNSSSTMRRSGESKQQDRSAESKVLEAYGALVRELAVRIYDVVSKARGEEVVWQASGCDEFDDSDRAQDLEEALAIDAINIPSETFKKAHKKQVAFKILGPIDPRTRAAIEQEIEEGVEAEVELREVMQQNAKDSADQGPDGMAQAATMGGQQDAPSGAANSKAAV